MAVLFSTFTVGILPTSGIGAGLSWYFRKRLSPLGDLVVLGVVLVYGLLGGPWLLCVASNPRAAAIRIPAFRSRLAADVELDADSRCLPGFDLVACVHALVKARIVRKDCRAGIDAIGH